MGFIGSELQLWTRPLAARQNDHSCVEGPAEGSAKSKTKRHSTAISDSLTSLLPTPTATTALTLD